MKQFPMNFRRYRQNAAIRDLFASVHLRLQDFIQPLFVYESLPQPLPLASLEGQTQHTLDSLKKEIEEGLTKGIRSILLFIIPAQKQSKSFKFDFDEQVIGDLKKTFGQDLILFTDLCLCSNTLTGHCGLENDHGMIINENSVEALTQKSLSYAQAGADVISPSDMMDDRILSIRESLDRHHLNHKLIMSYSTKFSSQFYGPFRDAAQSTPTYGDRKTYQIDPRNLGDALKSSIRDAKQGADILMVKPAGNYLDMLYRIKHHPETQHLPLCAYQVSGEYQSLWLMHKAGYLSFKEAYLESLVALKRSGSDFIISYGTYDLPEYLGM